MRNAFDIEVKLTPRLVLTLAVLAIASPSIAAPTMVFNSYGWSNVYTLNGGSLTGAATYVPPVDLLNTTFISQSDHGPDGRVWGTSGTELWAINPSQPAAAWQKISDVQTLAFDGLAWAPQNQLYLATLQEIHQVNPNTGATLPGTSLPVSKVGGPLQLQSIAFSPTGTLYAADTSSLYVVNRTTGVGTAIYTRPLNDTHSIFIDIDYGSDGIIRALSYLDYIFSFNPATNIGTWNPWTLSYNGQSFSPSALATVPEPATYAMFAVGGVILWWRRARNSRARLI